MIKGHEYYNRETIDIFIINLNAVKINFCEVLKTFLKYGISRKGCFSLTLRAWLKKQGVPFWNDGNYIYRYYIGERDE